MMNPMQLMNMLKGSGNPQQMLISMMKQQPGNNPVINNAIQMIQSGDQKGIERLARNLCAEKGIDPEQAYNQIKQQLGM